MGIIKLLLLLVTASSTYPELDLVRQRRRQNTVTAVGHAISWVGEAILVGIVLGLAYGRKDLIQGVTQMYIFMFPCINFVVFPFIQLATSAAFREDVVALCA